MKRGIGFYVRRLSERVHGKPEDFARNLASNGVRFVAFMACWQDEGGTQDPNKGRIARYARAVVDAGMEAWLWGFPRPNKQYQIEYFRCFAKHTEQCHALGYRTISGWLHDPEVYWQKKGSKPGIGMRGQGEAIAGVSDSGIGLAPLTVAAGEFVKADVLMRDQHKVEACGMTSYGSARSFGLPWSELTKLGFGSPQIYSADSREKVQGYLQAWREIETDLMPSIPTFGVNSGSADAIVGHANRFLNSDGSVPSDIHGFWIWSWEQTKGREWHGVKALAEKFQ